MHKTEYKRNRFWTTIKNKMMRVMILVRKHKINNPNRMNLPSPRRQWSLFSLSLIHIFATGSAETADLFYWNGLYSIIQKLTDWNWYWLKSGRIPTNFKNFIFENGLFPWKKQESYIRVNHNIGWICKHPRYFFSVFSLKMTINPYL